MPRAAAFLIGSARMLTDRLANAGLYRSLQLIGNASTAGRKLGWSSSVNFTAG